MRLVADFLAHPAEFHGQQLLALVREDDDLLRRDRKRMESVIRERARRAGPGSAAHSKLSSSVGNCPSRTSATKAANARVASAPRAA